MCQEREMRDREGFSRRQVVAGLGASGVGIAGLAAVCSARSAFADDGIADEATAAELLTPHAVPALNTAQGLAADSKRVLVVVDYQVDFADGALGNEYAVALEPAIYERVKAYQDAGDIVCYTMDTHLEEGYELTREGARVKPHCMLGTDGWELYGSLGELLTPETAIMVKKGTYGSSQLPAVLQGIKDQGTVLTSIELAGVSTTACVFHNAVMLYNMFPECEIVLDAATTTAKTPEATEAALKQLEGWGMVVRW